MTTTTTTAGELEPAGWRRQVAELYATVRQAPTPPEKEPRAMLTAAQANRSATR